MYDYRILWTAIGILIWGLSPNKYPAGVRTVIREGQCPSLSAFRTPLVPTPLHITQIQELQIDLVILHEDNISCSTPFIGPTLRIGTLDNIGMWQSRIRPCKFIQQNLIALSRLLLKIRLHNQSPFLIDLIIPAIITGERQLSR